MKTFHLLAITLLITGLMTSLARADEAEVRKLITTYVEAFNKQDINAVAGCWAEKCSHTDHGSGECVMGREAIVSDLAAVFKEAPDTRLSGDVERVRFITDDVAQVEGQTSVGTGREEPALNHFSAILVRKEGNWQIDSVEEKPLTSPETSYDALKQLEWMVGDWRDESDSGRVDTSVHWTVNNAFLLRSFLVTGLDGETDHGTQIIGWDPRAMQIRSWSFKSDGSFGNGTWSKNGDGWIIRSSQTLADGRAASGTYILSKTDDNSISMQLVGHEIEGEPQPTRPAVTIERVAEQALLPATETDKP